LAERYEKETGEKAIYRKDGADYHTLRYVEWLEGMIDEILDAVKINDKYPPSFVERFVV